MNCRVGAFTAALILCTVCVLHGGVYHVAPTGSDGNNGTSLASAWLTIARANSAAAAGDVVIVHRGVYTDGIAPVNSGTAGAPITFQAAPGEPVVVKAVTGIAIRAGQHDIVVEGFELRATFRVVDVQRASFITVRKLTCYGGRETYQAFNFNDCSYCVIQNNYLDRQDPDALTGGGDGLVVQGRSHHNLIEGNTVVRCEHVGFSSPYSGQSYNVWRGNRAYSNHTNYALFDGVERTVFEGNVGYYQGLVWTGGSGNCLQFTGNRCIIRFNTLYDDTATSYPYRQWPAVVGSGTGSANGLLPSVQYNKIYNNTIYGESDQKEWAKSGWRIDNYSLEMIQSDNAFKNNIFAAAPDAQVQDIDNVRPVAGMNNRYEGNLLCGSHGQPATIAYFFSGNHVRWTVPQARAAKPDAWAPSNKEGDPLFVNTAGQGPAKDFSLSAGSPAIDGGVHLTTALAGGSGRVLQVMDAGYFIDGWGIPQVEGDSIKIEGSAPVGIAAVDYTTNTLTLNGERSWGPGDRVFYYRSDRFQGNAPDIGAHESAGQAPPPPPPPPPSRPQPPFLVSPQNGAGGVNTNVTLGWNSSVAAFSYQVQVSRDASFGSLDINTTTTNQFLTLTSLSPATTFYWRVNAANTVGTSDWSAVWTLTTAAPASGGITSNVLSDPGFESSIDSWFAYSNGQADFSVSSPGFNSEHAARFHVAAAGDNIQIYQSNIPLAPNTTYVISFAAYSSTAHDLDISLGKHETPYTNYGLKGMRFDLDATWKTFTAEFTTSNFAIPVNDARLLIWFAPYAATGDDYYIDNIALSAVSYPLGSPIACAPPQGATSLPTDVTLKWLRRSDATTYDVELALDSSFTSKIASDTAVADTQYHVSSLKHLTTYYWHVRSRGSNGTGSFNAVQSFTTGAAVLSAPVWISASDTSSPVSFRVSWGSVAGATRYRLQVATDSSFEGIVLDDSTVADTARTVGPLQCGTRYFMRIQAIGPTGKSVFSAPLQFVTLPQIPAAPVFTDAPMNKGSVPVEFTVAWSQVPGASRYHLQIASDSIFQALIYDDSTITDTARRIGPFREATTYFMRLCALNSGGQSEFSSTVRFTTSASQLAVPFLVVAPGQNTNWPVVATIRWLPVSDAVQYHLQLATDMRFTALVLDDSTVTDTVTHVGPLSYSTVYFVRVRAINNHAASGFSLPVVFSTVAAPLAPPAGIGLVSEAQKTSATLCWSSVHGASLYHLQVSKDSLFTVFTVDDSSVTDTARAIATLEPSTRYFARVRAKGAVGTSGFSAIFGFSTASPPPPPTSDVPKDYYLEQNYPNPFNPKTVVRSQTPEASNVKLVVYDVLGREVAVLVNELRAAGRYQDTFDGSGLSSGVYVFRLTAGSYVQSRTMLLMK